MAGPAILPPINTKALPSPTPDTSGPKSASPASSGLKAQPPTDLAPPAQSVVRPARLFIVPVALLIGLLAVAAAGAVCGQGSIADIIACTPDPAALTTLALQKWNGSYPDQGLVLLQIAADRGSAAAALKLAQIYDPNMPYQGAGRAQPNARDAAQYYRLAARAHENAATAPREALRQRLQRDTEIGDAMALRHPRTCWRISTLAYCF